MNTIIVNGEELVSLYRNQRIHYDKKRIALASSRTASLDALLSKCEAIVRSYDIAKEQQAKDFLLSKTSKKNKKSSTASTPVIDKDGFVTVTHKRGRSVAASLSSATSFSQSKTDDCLFPFYDPDSSNDSEESLKEKGPIVIPNFYRSDKRAKNIEEIRRLRQQFTEDRKHISDQRSKRSALR